MLELSPDFFIFTAIKIALTGLVLGMNAIHAFNIRAWWINLLRVPGLIVFLWLIWIPENWMYYANEMNYGAGMVGALILNGILNLLVFVLRNEVDSGTGELGGIEARRRLPQAAEDILKLRKQPDPYEKGFEVLDEKKNGKGVPFEN